ncbi:MAG: HEAT repeat domain-containing protein [Cyanobacteria bacterium P01_E01_bin.42]
MDVIIGLLVGCGASTVIGTGLYTSALKKQRRAENIALEKLRQELNQAHERELQQTIANLKTEYTQQLEEREGQLKQEAQQQAESQEQEYQGQLADAIAAREEVDRSLLLNSEEADIAIAYTEIKHAREIEELKAQMLLERDREVQDAKAQTEAKYAGEIEALKGRAISSPSPSVPPVESTKSDEIALPDASLAQLLDRTYHPDPEQRQQIALAIGEAIAGRKVRAESERAIPILGKLSQDPDPAVRCAAVTALAGVDSQAAIPYLQRALKDADSNAIAAASEAIAKFKRSGFPTKAAKPAPKNAAARQEPNS